MLNKNDIPDENKIHMMIIMQIWEDLAADIYQAYKEQGRGVVVMFMMDTLPDPLKARLPRDGAIKKGALSAYISHDNLLVLEELVGERGVLRIDRQINQYNPDTTILFAFLRKGVSEGGEPGIASFGYEITPPSRLSPLEMYKKKNPLSARKIFPFDSNQHPLISLN